MPTASPLRADRRPRSWPSLGDELLDVIHRYPDHVWVFLHEFPALTGTGPNSSACGAVSTRGGSRRSCVPGSRAGEFRGVDPWLAARAWLGMHNYTYLWLKPGGRLSARSVAHGPSPRSSCAASPTPIAGDES